MIIYRHCPTRKSAKEAWKFFVKKNKEEPRSIMKLPNNFKKEFTVESGAWGLWVADYVTWKDYYNPNTDIRQDPVRNVFSFIKKQTILSKVVDNLRGET